MGTPTITKARCGPRSAHPLARCIFALALLAGSSGCLFGGGSAEDEIDPNEATAREANYRTEAERARDSRFGDRLRRRTDLSEPVRSASEPEQK